MTEIATYCHELQEQVGLMQRAVAGDSARPPKQCVPSTQNWHWQRLGRVQRLLMRQRFSRKSLVELLRAAIAEAEQRQLGNAVLERLDKALDTHMMLLIMARDHTGNETLVLRQTTIGQTHERLLERLAVYVKASEVPVDESPVDQPPKDEPPIEAKYRAGGTEDGEPLTVDFINEFFAVDGSTLGENIGARIPDPRKTNRQLYSWKALCSYARHRRTKPANVEELYREWQSSRQQLCD